MCLKNKHIINLILENKISNYNSVLNNKIYLKFLLKNNLYEDFINFINKTKYTKNINYSDDINYIKKFAKNNYKSFHNFNDNNIINYLIN